MVDGALLHRTVERYELLDAERMATQEEQAEVLKAAVEAGFDKLVLKRFIRELRRDPALMKAERDLLQDYRDAWEKFEATPLGAYAKGRPEPTDGASQLKTLRMTGVQPSSDGANRDRALNSSNFERGPAIPDGEYVLPDGQVVILEAVGPGGKNADDVDAAAAEVTSIKAAAEAKARGNGRKKRATAAELEAERQKQAAEQPKAMFDA